MAKLTVTTPARVAQVLGVSLVSVMTMCGCGQALQPGLPNTPGTNHEWTQDERGRDVVSNGDESCARPGKPGEDPLPGRRPKCPESAPIAKK